MRPPPLQCARVPRPRRRAPPQLSVVPRLCRPLPLHPWGLSMARSRQGPWHGGDEQDTQIHGFYLLLRHQLYQTLAAISLNVLPTSITSDEPPYVAADSGLYLLPLNSISTISLLILFFVLMISQMALN